jgi:hypothetical protein
MKHLQPPGPLTHTWVTLLKVRPGNSRRAARELGYTTTAEFMESEFPQSVPVPIEYRPAVYEALAVGGMSNIAIGKATGMSEGAVRLARKNTSKPPSPQVKELPSRKSVQVRQGPAPGEPQRETAFP